jgi:heptosyltransferase III
MLCRRKALSAMKTAVIHTGGIGDLLLACPAIAYLAREGPVTLFGQPDRLELAMAAGIAEAAHSLDSMDFSSVFSQPSTRFLETAGTYDRAVIWMRENGEITRAFQAAGVRNIRCFPGLPPPDWREHASAYYGRCIGADVLPPFQLRLEAAGPGPDVVIHPGSGGHRKNLPLEDFSALARMLENQGRRITWCAGPAEDDLPLPDSAPVLRESSLVMLARRLRGAKLYLGNDSGITHLAAATGCPVIAFFGPTAPAVWAPRGDNVWIARFDVVPEVTRPSP